MNPFSQISPGMQKKLVGGLIGSLTYWADRALSESYASYPAQLKAHMISQLPANDELLTTIATPAIMYVVGKKSKKVAEMAKGTMLFSAPKLVNRVIVNAATPVTTTTPASFSVQQRVMPVNVAPKYTQTPIQVSKPSYATAATQGKYR